MPAVAPQLKKAGRSDGAHDDDLSAGPGDASEAADRRQQVVTVQHVEVRDGGQAIVAGRMKGGGAGKTGGGRGPLGPAKATPAPRLHPLCRRVKDRGKLNSPEPRVKVRNV